ncbi:hypothetical protein, partial [Micromonospora chalcea]|uniref:hypothetical protein n=1 Tax=Micromonospora chalcea TaxID=1874 RepID=UPI001ABF8352
GRKCIVAGPGPGPAILHFLPGQSAETGHPRGSKSMINVRAGRRAGIEFKVGGGHSARRRGAAAETRTPPP